MNKNPYLSIIILIYQDESFLPDCLSLLLKSLKKAKVSYEFIFVINDINLKINKIKIPGNSKIIQNKINKGFAKSFNQAEHHAYGEWLLSINPDTRSDVNLIPQLLRFTKDKDVAAIVPKVLNQDGSLQFTQFAEPTIWNIFLQQSYLYKLFPNIFHHPLADKSQYEKIHYISFTSGTCLLIKKNILNEIGKFDENYFLYFDDCDLWKRLKKTKYKILYNPHAQIIHYRHQSSKGRVDVKNYIKSNYYFLRKYHSQLYAQTGILIMLIGSLIRLIIWSVRHAIADTNKKSEASSKIQTYLQFVIYSFKIISYQV